MFKQLISVLKPYAPGLFPDPPTKPNYPQEVYQYSTQAWGSHQDGNYVMGYIPHRDTPATPQVVIYLHGFAFGNPYYYDAHMQHLAKQGYYVFFADYQKDKYPNDQTPQSPKFGNVDQLIAAVVDSFQTSGEEMIKTAWAAVQNAMQTVLGQTENVDIYLFGHSVGGLFVLSWPNFVGTQNIKAIMAADPISATAELPEWIIKHLSIKSPFLQSPIDIKTTGAGLGNIPVALLIGNSDLFVKPATWQNRWSYLATATKQMYISQSDYYYNIYRCDAKRALIAYHNQSVTNKLLDLPDDAIAEDVELIIGGAGVENNMRWRFVWDAFDAVLQGTSVKNLTFDMSTWSNGRKVTGVKPWSN
jgi:hypothetical protein